MQRKNLAVAIALAVVSIPAIPTAAAEARDTVATASAGWHGRAVEDPRPRPKLARTAWPAGWSAGAVARGSGYERPQGSRRVREIQRRLRQLGYRPGPVDGRFGPRTRAATRWFQYKHGFAHTGRVNRATLTVLRARSEHRPLPASSLDTQRADIERPSGESPGVVRTDGETSGVGVAELVIAALLALIAGLLVGGYGPDRARRRDTQPSAPAGVPVYGYVPTDAQLHSDTAVAAIAALCARRGWSIAKLVRDPEPASGRIVDRPGLVYALGEIHTGAASGLIVARVRDLTTRLGDLVALIESLTAAGAFVASADRELDTSTGTGRATAHAMLELASWERPQRDRLGGRFQPHEETRDLGPCLTAMRERGIPLRAIADALNLARIPNPAGHTHWRPANVQAATREESQARR
jgi:peptidoglycan hydrolase-like protein with peptidoglycan-binding domain